MKRFALFAVLVAVLGGCVVAPVAVPVHPVYGHGYVGYGYHTHDHGWYRYDRGRYRY
jgi:hypothetical protein